MEGWIKLYSKFLKWEWIESPEMVSLFIYLLLSANYESKNWHGKVINRGECILSTVKTSKLLGMSRQTLRTCLMKLKTTNEIETQSTNKYTIITISNYEKYQHTTKVLTNDQPTKNSKSTNNSTNNKSAIISLDSNQSPLEQLCINQQVNQRLTNKSTKPKERKNKEEEVIESNLLIESSSSKESKNISSYEEMVDKPQAGNQEINEVVTFLKDKIGGSPDGSQQQNRRFAHLLINKFKKDYPDKIATEQIKALIDLGLQDQFHGKNITSFKYLYYNTQKIIQSIKNLNNKIVII